MYKTIFKLSIIKAVVLSLFLFILEMFYIDLIVNRIELIFYAIILFSFSYLGYKEYFYVPNKPYWAITASSFFGSLLLLLNPMFWGAGGGHSPLSSNIIGVPVCFFIMLFLGCFGGLIAKKRQKKIL